MTWGIIWAAERVFGIYQTYKRNDLAYLHKINIILDNDLHSPVILSVKLPDFIEVSSTFDYHADIADRHTPILTSLVACLMPCTQRGECGGLRLGE